MKQNIVYYNNQGEGSKITRELVTNIFQALANNLSSESFLDFVSVSRVPNERELYGLFVKSIIEACKEKDLGHIATEFQVMRVYSDSEKNDSKGRVDLMFNYRTVSYLIELKVGRVNARAFSGDDKGPKIRAKRIWRKAIDQLDELHMDSVNNLLKNKIVKLPIALYFFESRVKLVETTIEYKYVHQNILSSITVEDDECLSPDFYLYSSLPCTSTRLRNAELKTNNNNYLYGFSIFAKQKYCAKEEKPV